LEFAHAGGLSVLAVGDEPPAAVRSLLEAPEAETAALRRFFAELGGRLSLGLEVQRLESERARAARDVGILRAEVARGEAALEAPGAKLAGAEEEPEAVAVQAAWMDAHPIWRSYLALRLRLVPRGSSRERALGLARRELHRLRVEGPGATLRR